MSGPDEGWDPGDERLLADIGDAVRRGRDVPERLVELGRAAFAWHDIDVDLAALRYDSAVSGLPAGVRAGGGGLRALSFETDAVAIEVELSAEALVGQVVPQQLGTVELWVDGAEPRSVAMGQHGWFRLGPPPTRPFRLCVRAASTVLTDRINPEGLQPAG